MPDIRRNGPTRRDLLALRKAYKAFQATAMARAMSWKDLNSQEELKAAEKADSDALEPVQKAWIKATSYVNSADRWPLITENMILKMLQEAGLWDEPHVTRDAWEKAS